MMMFSDKEFFVPFVPFVNFVRRLTCKFDTRPFNEDFSQRPQRAQRTQTSASSNLFEHLLVNSFTRCKFLDGVIYIGGCWLFFILEIEHASYGIA
jgi:hypothetical protein